MLRLPVKFRKFKEYHFICKVILFYRIEREKRGQEGYFKGFVGGRVGNFSQSYVLNEEPLRFLIKNVF